MDPHVFHPKGGRAKKHLMLKFPEKRVIFLHIHAFYYAWGKNYIQNYHYDTLKSILCIDIY